MRAGGLCLVSCVGGRRCFLAARENDSQRRGPACWLWEQKSQSRGTVLGKKTEEEVAACVGGGLPKRSNGFSFSFFSKGRGQPYPAAESQALGWREEEKNLIRMGGGGSG